MPAVHQDYYTILGVPRDADEQTIKRAFRHLAFEYHPDRNKAPGAEERFKATLLLDSGGLCSNVVREGVPVVLEQKTTILWKYLYLLASLKDSPDLSEM